MSDQAVQTIDLLIVDDHAMFRDALARVLSNEPDFHVAGQCASSSEALLFLRANKPDLVLLDVDLGSERGLEFVLTAKLAGFAGRILIVTAGISNEEAIRLIEAGVAGILHKHHSTNELFDAIRQVAAGEAWLEKDYLAPLFRSVDRNRDPASPRLTGRDAAVLRYIFQGLTNKEIGMRLQTSEGAVKAYVRQICGKLGVRTRAQLVKVALEQYRDQI